jgi:uncharacterized protein (UPF0276 family)
MWRQTGRGHDPSGQQQRAGERDDPNASGDRGAHQSGPGPAHGAQGCSTAGRPGRLRSGDLFLSRRASPMVPKTITGIGLGLRWEILDEVLSATTDELEHVRFFEVSPENYLGRGGYFPDALARIGARSPLTTHGLTLSLGGTDPLDRGYLQELSRFLARFGGDWHSDHLSFSTLDGVVLHELLPLPFTHATVRRVSDRIRAAEDQLGRRLAVENLTYYATLGASELTEPDFIAEILERSGAALLLDLNNLDVNAENHGFDRHRWLERIPLERVVELHVAGPERWDDGLWLDTHGAPVRPSVYELLEDVVARIGPVPVLLERDHAVPPLRELLAEVAALDARYRAAVQRWAAGRKVHDAA